MSYPFSAGPGAVKISNFSLDKPFYCGMLEDGGIVE